MGISLISWKIRNFLLKQKVELIRMLLSITPYPIKKNIFLRLFLNMIPNKTSGGNLITKIKNNILIYWNRNLKYDLVFVAGNIANKIAITKKSKKIITFKSFDTLNYEKTKTIKYLKKPIIFIDNDITDNVDYIYHGTKSPVNKEQYYNSLNLFFEFLEKKFKTNVVIASHPKRNLAIIGKNFGNRKIYKNKTAELIKNCKFSIAHSSTALSFCILSNTPIIFITNNEIEMSWFKREIDFSALQLKNKVFNIDKYNNYKNIDNYLNINNKTYKSYAENYLFKKRINKKITLTKILNKYLDE